MSEINFSHLIEIDESTRLLRIHRALPDGHRHLFTEMPLPPYALDTQPSRYAEFAQKLGENILLDSPVARRALGL